MKPICRPKDGSLSILPAVTPCIAASLTAGQAEVFAINIVAFRPPNVFRKPLILEFQAHESVRLELRFEAWDVQIIVVQG